MRASANSPLSNGLSTPQHSGAERRVRSCLAPCAAAWVLISLGCGGTSGGTLGGQSGGAAQLVGDWLGPFPTATGSCGASYGEFFFQANGSYAFNGNSENCGGFTPEGTYTVASNVITFHQTRVPNCPTCTQSLEYSVTFSFVTANDLQVCSGLLCYTYARQ
jgi:hypothetical protein